MEFKEAIKACKADQKIVFGTRNEDYHVISSDDRDYYMRWAFTKEEAIKQGSDSIKFAILRPRLL